jgi:hypothetical protein
MLGLLSTLGACSNSSPTEPLPPSKEVRYHLNWDLDRVSFTDDGKSWQLVTDRGYTVTLSRGLFVNYSVELIPCDPPKALTPIEPTAARSWFAVPSALAGHSLLDLNAARILPHLAESLLQPQDSTAGSALPGQAEYCGAHYLVARAQKGATFDEGDEDIMGKSLIIKGSYRKADDDSETPFEFQSSAANGRFWKVGEGLPGWKEPRSEADLAIETVFNNETSDADVTVTRKLGSLFDEVDFEAMSPRAISWVVLRNLLATAQLTISVEDEGSLSVRKVENQN